MSDRAGTPAQPQDLVDIEELLTAYRERVPDAEDPAPRTQTRHTKKAS